MKKKPIKLKWLRDKIHSPYSDWIFVIPFLLEAFLLFPLDIVIAFFCLERPNRNRFYIVSSAIASTIGASIGYILGACAWETRGHKLVYMAISPTTFQRLIAYYTQCHIPVIYLGGLLPLPFKMFTLSAGFCRLPFISFLIFIFLTRLTRYGLIALAINSWGQRVIQFIDRLSIRMVLLSGLKLSLLVSCAWILT